MVIEIENFETLLKGWQRQTFICIWLKLVKTLELQGRMKLKNLLKLFFFLI